MKLTKSLKVLCIFATILTSDFVWGMDGMTGFEIPMLIGWLITAYILFKYGDEALKKYMCVAMRVLIILNLLISIIFTFLFITCQGPLQIDYINELYHHLFGSAVVAPEYKWADHILNGLILSEMAFQMLFKIMLCVALYQNSKGGCSSKTDKFVKKASLIYIPFYIAAKTFVFIDHIIRILIEKNDWSLEFSQWWFYHSFDLMINLWIIATAAFLILAFVRIFRKDAAAEV